MRMDMRTRTSAPIISVVGSAVKTDLRLNLSGFKPQLDKADDTIFIVWQHIDSSCRRKDGHG